MTNTLSIPSIDYKFHPEKGLDFGIGICGAGFIVRACHIPAYKKAGYNIAGIFSRTKSNAMKVANDFGIKKVYDSFEEMCRDPKIEVVDLAFPPHEQPELVRTATKYGKHILCQKPLAMNLKEGREIIALAEKAGVKLGVNQNMRYSPAMRYLKGLINQGYLGRLIFSVFYLYSPGHWQTFLKDYERLVILNLSVHHLDIYRFLYGEPESVYAAVGGIGMAELHAAESAAYDVEKLKGLRFKGEILATYTLKYPDGLIAVGIDDGFNPSEDKHMIWRVEGMEGLAKGTIGWPRATSDTIEYRSKKIGDTWVAPDIADWNWFPDAFIGTMGQLLQAIKHNKEPEISGQDNIKTMALIEACYKSVEERREVKVSEVYKS